MVEEGKILEKGLCKHPQGIGGERGQRWECIFFWTFRGQRKWSDKGLESNTLKSAGKRVKKEKMEVITNKRTK